MAKWTLPRRVTSGQWEQAGSGDRTVCRCPRKSESIRQHVRAKELPVFHYFSRHTPPGHLHRNRPKRNSEKLRGRSSERRVHPKSGTFMWAKLLGSTHRESFFVPSSTVQTLPSPLTTFCCTT